MYSFRKPLLPNHYHVWFDPPDESGSEVMHIESDCRSLTLKGHSFRDFHRYVIPLLDGKHTMEEICKENEDIFAAQDIEAALRLLADQGVLVEGNSPDEMLNFADPAVVEKMTPQLNFFHDTLKGGRLLQSRLSNSDVAVLGLGPVGANAAIGLAAAGIGKLRLVDANQVSTTDTYFAPCFANPRSEEKRATQIKNHIEIAAPQIRTECHSNILESEQELWAVIEGADYVVCCWDAGMVNLIYKLNRICRNNRMPWIYGAQQGAEVAVGPAFLDQSGPCFTCYRMRSVACSGNPKTAFELEQYLDRKKQDLSGQSSNIVFGTAMVANLLGMEVTKALTGSTPPSLAGKILTINLLDLSVSKHVVLKKPFCPECGASHE